MPSVHLMLHVSPAPGEDEFALDDSVQRLRGALLGTDVDTVERMRAAAATPGAKGVVEVVEGTLALGLALDAGLIQSVAEILVAFAQRGRGRRIQVRHGDHELIIDGASRRDVKEVISEFYELARRADER